MLFSSPVFLFLFLPITLFVYYISPKKFKNVVLLVFSLIFYSWGEKELVVLILLSTIVDYSSALIIESGKKKMGLLLSIVFNLGILLYFKYSDFAYSNLAALLSNLNINQLDATRFANVVLPLGISFYTFQTMSYTIDVYRGHVKASRKILNFATYVSLFPQLIAGPIVRYKDVETQLTNRENSVSQFADGIQRFCIGLAKKMIIANNCAYLADSIFDLPQENLSSLVAWIGVIAYSFQIYFDFSGYSDMAIGLGKMFGFNFPENFNFPYISKSIREFWRRWHMTLSFWFRDYVYISLGGNRKGHLHTYINLIIVFFVTGLWHGANWTFIFWGLLHGFFIILERSRFGITLEKLPLFIRHFYLIFVVSISWVFFRSDTISEAFSYLKAMFSFNRITNMEMLSFYMSKEIIFALFLAVLFSTRLVPYMKLNLKFNHHGYIYIKYAVILSIFILCCVYIAVDSYNPFIYFRF